VAAIRKPSHRTPPIDPFDRNQTEHEKPEEVSISMLIKRTLARAAGLMVALSALALTSRAQAPGGQGAGMASLMGGGGQNNPVMLLLAPSIQKELKLNEEQKTKAYSLTKTAGQKSRELFQSMALGGNANPQGMMQLRHENDQAIAKILDTKQKERFDQIVLRVEGPLAVARPEVAAKLKLNDTQNGYVQEIMMQMRRELFMTVQQGAANGPINPAQIKMVTAELRKNAVNQLKKVINSKQQTAFNEMLGEPFDVSKIDEETAAADATANPSADPSKPADPSQAKDAPAASPEKETTKEPAVPAKKKGRLRPNSKP